MANEPAQRQYEIDRLTARYVDEYRAGRAPRVEEYIQRHPEYERELIDFVFYFHTVGEHLPEPAAIATESLSSDAMTVLARIRQADTPSAPETAPAPITSLAARARELGIRPPELVAAVGISTNILGKLEARAIAAQSIPRTLIERFAATLRVAPEAIATYLSASAPAEAGAFFYADKPPARQQEDFLDAIAGSALPEERKREWREIVAREQADS